jgi:hypothetical protein
VAVAQLVERRIVIPVVEGSIPFSHPTYFYTLCITLYSPYYFIFSVLLYTLRIIFTFPITLLSFCFFLLFFIKLTFYYFIYLILSCITP